MMTLHCCSDAAQMGLSHYFSCNKLSALERESQGVWIHTVMQTFDFKYTLPKFQQFFLRMPLYYIISVSKSTQWVVATPDRHLRNLYQAVYILQWLDIPRLGGLDHLFWGSISFSWCKMFSQNRTPLFAWRFLGSRPQDLYPDHVIARLWHLNFLRFHYQDQAICKFEIFLTFIFYSWLFYSPTLQLQKLDAVNFTYWGHVYLLGKGYWL